MSDITLTYKGNTIGTLDASGSMTLDTAGKYCEDDIGLTYVKPSGGTLVNLLSNGDFHDGTTGWSSLASSNSSISVADGWLVLTHTATSNRAYGTACSANIIANHTYLLVATVKKTMSDSDADSRGVAIRLGGTLASGAYIQYYTGVSQNDLLSVVGAVKADANYTAFHFGFLGSIATAAANESMMELHDVRLYDITDIIPS